jgi:hypothetical protein
VWLRHENADAAGRLNLSITPGAFSYPGRLARRQPRHGRLLALSGRRLHADVARVAGFSDPAAYVTQPIFSHFQANEGIV